MSNTKLKKILNLRQVSFIAIGSSIGTGLFLGSASAISAAGPSVLLSFILCGFVVYIIMRSLGEMTLVNPLEGSFSAYAKQYVSPLFGFVTGWMYIIEMISVCIADMTACGIYLQYWFPSIPQWSFVLVIACVIMLIHLCSVRLFAEMEFSLTLIKIVAIIAMIGLAACLLLFSHNDSFTVANLWQHGGYFPHGVSGMLWSFVFVMFSFGGIETLGIAAVESQNTLRAVPTAINQVPLRVILFYVLSILAILTIVPWDQIGVGQNPFVKIFSYTGFHAAAAIFSVVAIVASISAINSDVYGISRVMHSLSKEGLFMQRFARTNSSGSPSSVLLLLFPLLVAGVILNYLLPHKLFVILAAIATFATVWVWLSILLAHLAMRYQGKKNKQFLAPAFPYFQVGSVGFLLLVFYLIYAQAEMRMVIYAGVAALLGLVLIYSIIKRKS